MRVQFVLPKGAYATTVLSNVFEIAEPSGKPDEATGESNQSNQGGRTEEE